MSIASQTEEMQKAVAEVKRAIFAQARAELLAELGCVAGCSGEGFSREDIQRGAGLRATGAGLKSDLSPRTERASETSSSILSQFAAPRPELESTLHAPNDLIFAPPPEYVEGIHSCYDGHDCQAQPEKPGWETALDTAKREVNAWKERPKLGDCFVCQAPIFDKWSGGPYKTCQDHRKEGRALGQRIGLEKALATRRAKKNSEPETQACMQPQTIRPVDKAISLKQRLSAKPSVPDKPDDLAGYRKVTLPPANCKPKSTRALNYSGNAILADESADYLLKRIKSKFPERIFQTKNAMVLADMDESETVFLLSKLKKEGKLVQIDSVRKHHLARWRWIA